MKTGISLLLIMLAGRAGATECLPVVLKSAHADVARHIIYAVTSSQTDHPVLDVLLGATAPIPLNTIPIQSRRKIKESEFIVKVENWRTFVDNVETALLELPRLPMLKLAVLLGDEDLEVMDRLFIERQLKPLAELGIRPAFFSRGSVDRILEAVTLLLLLERTELEKPRQAILRKLHEEENPWIKDQSNLLAMLTEFLFDEKPEYIDTLAERGPFPDAVRALISVIRDVEACNPQLQTAAKARSTDGATSP
jgi:hypothetical protein